MIRHDALEKKLNDIKKVNTTQEEIQPQTSIDNTSDLTVQKSSEQLKSDFKILLQTSIIELISILILSTIYGYGFKTIFNQSWSFIGLFSVGFIFHQTLIFILKLFSSKNNL